MLNSSHPIKLIKRIILCNLDQSLLQKSSKKINLNKKQEQLAMAMAEKDKGKLLKLLLKREGKSMSKDPKTVNLKLLPGKMST